VITRDTWERQFTHQLKQQLEIEPEQIRFHWKGTLISGLRRKGRSHI